MPNSKQIVYLSQTQYAELIANGSITVDGVTVQYDENDIYVTPQAEPVTDVRVAGTSVAANGVAEIPPVNGNTAGVVRIGITNGFYGIYSNNNGVIMIQKPEDNEIKNGANTYKPIVPAVQDASTFYGLAKAAGHDEKDSTESVGTYTPEAKGAIQQMLGVSDLIATAENDLVASKAYKVGDIFTANGKLYKATAAIAADAAIIPEVEGEEIAGANCVETNVGEGFVKFTDYARNTRNLPNSAGIVGVNDDYGITINNNQPGHYLYLTGTTEAMLKEGTHSYRSISPARQHQATFYGLAKAAGADEKNSTLPVGQYTDTAKSAIRSMIGATSSNVIAVQDTQPTDADTKIWLPETAETPVEVPTVAEMNTALSEKVGDVQVNGSSVVSNGIANMPVASENTLGVVKINPNRGINIDLSNNKIYMDPATKNEVKAGTTGYRPITPYFQHISAFYGLAKAAGDTTQSQSDNAVGTYTDEAKSAIQTMLGIDLSSIASQVEIPLVETVTGAAVTINGQPNTRYMCGEVTSISITPPAAGSIDVVFTSGSTVAVLTLPSTVKMPEWFDATTLDTNTIYEILITDGVYGSVMTWQA